MQAVSCRTADDGKVNTTAVSPAQNALPMSKARGVFSPDICAIAPMPAARTWLMVVAVLRGPNSFT
jgi:hypothetical protein